MSVIKHIPNFLTCCNLLCGCLSLLCAAEGRLLWAAYLILTATLFDFADGLTARMLKVTSELGKQLDSLADMITFGIAPGILIYFLLSHPDLAPPLWGNGSIPVSHTAENFYNSLSTNPAYLIRTYAPYFALIIPIFSAFRLAKFNIDESQATTFKGLATPTNAVFFAGFTIFTTIYVVPPLRL